MGIEAVLAEMGYRPKGGGSFLQKMGRYMQYQEAERQKKQKELSERFDMYKTLRQSGYDSKSAYDAVELKKYGVPEPTGGTTTLKEQQAQATIEKTQAQTTKINKEIIEPKMSDSEKFRKDLQGVIQGKKDWEDLQQDWPDRTDTIEKRKKQYEAAGILKQPLTKQPIKQVGAFNLIARTKPEYAHMTPDTQAVVNKIKTNQDLLGFIKNADALEQNGVNVEALQNYYAKEINDLITQGLVKQK